LTSQQEYLQRLADFEAAVARAQPDPVILVERAAGLIAGRAGCRIDEAHAQLRLLATEQGREPSEVAADLLAILQTSLSGDKVDVRTALEEALQPARRAAPATGPAPAHPAPLTVDPGWAETMRQIVGAVAGDHTVVAPVRDADGRPADFVFVAVTATVLDQAGRREEEVIGRPVGELYPGIVDGPVWQAWKDVLADGLPRDVGPIPYEGMTLVVRVHPAGPGLFNSWVRPDEESRLGERLAQPVPDLRTRSGRRAAERGRVPGDAVARGRADPPAGSGQLRPRRAGGRHVPGTHQGADQTPALGD
jgi:hypothetical protein